MGTTKLQIYNTALTEYLGLRKLASISEARETRYALDDSWDAGLVDECLEQGQWKFAIRTTKLEYSASVTPAFGYSRGFEKPTDMVRMTAICSDERFKSTVLHYQDEAGFWFCDLDEIYVSYISNDVAYGNDLSLWPPGFVSFVAATLASKKAFKLTQSKQIRDDVMAEAAKLLADAKSTDAQAGPPKFDPPGGWATARRGGKRGDRGNTGSLIGG